MSEEKLGMVTSRFGTSDFALFFTPAKIVAAKTGSSLMWASMFGALGQSISSHLAKKKATKLSDLTLDSIVSSNKKNFCINCEDVVRAEVKKPNFFMTGKFIVDTGKKKFKFLLMDKKDFDLAKNVISKSLGDKVAA